MKVSIGKSLLRRLGPLARFTGGEAERDPRTKNAKMREMMGDFILDASGRGSCNQYGGC